MNTGRYCLPIIIATLLMLGASNKHGAVETDSRLPPAETRQKAEDLGWEVMRGLEDVVVCVDARSDALKEAGLEQDVLKAKVEQQLHEAGIAIRRPKTEDFQGSPTLYVSLNALPFDATTLACSINVSLAENVRLERNALRLSDATVWHTSRLGFVRGAAAQQVSAGVAGCVSQFIDLHSIANPALPPVRMQPALDR